jgi:hypothetical protein
LWQESILFQTNFIFYKMKKTVFAIFILITLPTIVKAQRFEKVVDEWVEVNSKTNFLTLGSKGRTNVFSEILLPQNTIGYIYRVSIFKKSSENSNSPSLFDCLKQMLPTEIKMGIELAEFSIKQNDGESIDFFIINNRNDAINFENDLGFESCHRYLSHFNFCASSDRCLGKQLYFGFKNNNIKQGLKVHFELTAITKEEEIVNGWTTARKDEIFKMFKFVSEKLCSNFSDGDRFRFASCGTKKLTTQYSDASIRKLSEHEILELISKLCEECSKDLNYECIPKNLKMESFSRDNIIGRWKDENSTMAFSGDGTFFIKFEGQNDSFQGEWRINDNKLSIIISGKTDNYEIIEFQENSFKYRYIKSGTIFNATKINY